LNEWENIDEGDSLDLSADANDLIVTSATFDLCELSLSTEHVEYKVIIHPYLDLVNDLLQAEIAGNLALYLFFFLMRA
jgi:hypothetical protein